MVSSFLHDCFQCQSELLDQIILKKYLKITTKVILGWLTIVLIIGPL